MNRFIKWFNSESTIEPVIKSGLAHLWFFECITGALEATDETLAKVLTIAKFWEKHATYVLKITT